MRAGPLRPSSECSGRRAPAQDARPDAIPASDVQRHGREAWAITKRQVVACRPKDDIRDAEKAMAKNHKSRILCVDDSDRLVGIISLSDIAQHERGSRASDTLREVSEREVRA